MKIEDLPPAKKESTVKGSKPGTKTPPEPDKVYRTYEDFDEEKLFLYAGLDCIATSTLLAKIYPDLIDEPVHFIPGVNKVKIKTRLPSLLEVHEDIGKLVMDFILDLEINGLKYDIEKNAAISLAMTEEIEDLESKIFRQIGKKIDLNSGTVMREFFYVELGMKPPSFTKSGEPSTDGEALLALAGLDPINPPRDYITSDPSKQWMAWLAKRNDINSCHNTFIKNYVKDFVKSDGCIHPSYNLHGTSSFRITGDSPNLTQLPRPKHGYNVRTCYTVEDGYIFIAFDFSSAEVKILGALCKDPNILKAIEEGLDFHSFSASSMMGITYEAFMAVLGDKNHPDFKDYKLKRQIAKILNVLGPCIAIYIE